MKKIILSIASFVLIINTGISQSSIQNGNLEENRNIFLLNKNTLSFSPFNIIFNQFQFSYERRFGKNNSFMLLGSILHNRDAMYNSYTGYQFGLASELHYRKYIYNTSLKTKKNPGSKNAIGMYFAPFLGYQYLERELNEIYHYGPNENDFIEYQGHGIQNAVQLGLVSGFNLNLLKGRLNIDLYAGFAEKLSFANDNVVNYRSGVIDPGILKIRCFGNYS